MQPRWIIGLAGGAGHGGADAVLAEVHGQGLDLTVLVAHAQQVAYPADLHDLLGRLTAAGPVEVRGLALAHRALGEALATAACQLADQASISLQKVLCLGYLGPALWHDGDHRLAATQLLGAAAVLAERTGLTTVSDFPWRDLAGGGHGMPLAPLADRVLFGAPAENRLLLHLGPLAEATYLPADPGQPPLAWVIGPGTLFLDGLLQLMTGGRERTDSGGRWAVQGRQVPELLERWLSHPFLMRRPPRSTHRGTFGEEFARQTLALARQRGWASHDVLCTANHLVARAALDSLRRFLPLGCPVERVILTGHGVKNGLLWRLLEEQLPPGRLMERSETVGVPAEAKAALDAALLACFFLDGVPASLPGVTGAAGPRLLGSLTPGSGANWGRCLAWLTGQGHLLPEEED